MVRIVFILLLLGFAQRVHPMVTQLVISIHDRGVADNRGDADTAFSQKKYGLVTQSSGLLPENLIRVSGWKVGQQ